MGSWPKVPKDIEASISHFSLVLPYLGSEYEVISKLGYQKKLDEGYLWTFPLEKLGEVQNALGGTIISFSKTQILTEVISHCDPLQKEIEVSMEKKGRGSLTTFVDDMVYVVRWYEHGTPKYHRVPRSLVEFIWTEVVSKLDYGPEGKRPTRWIAERIVGALGKHHWDIDELLLAEEDTENKRLVGRVSQGKWNHERSGAFNWAYFQGSRTKGYFPLYYYPMKCLQGLGLVDGWVTRICHRDEYDTQRKFAEKVFIEQEREEQKLYPGTAEDPNTWDRYSEYDETGQGRFKI